MMLKFASVSLAREWRVRVMCKYALPSCVMLLGASVTDASRADRRLIEVTCISGILFCHIVLVTSVYPPDPPP